jgi:adenosylhomocysteinase
MSPDRNLIVDRPDEVYALLFNALDRLIINRISDKAFTDQEDVSAKAYFSTLEGLEALLIPFVNLSKTLWDSLTLRHKDLPAIISEDMGFILSHNAKEYTAPKEQGAPYFEQGTGVTRTTYWTSECASFTLSVLRNYIRLTEKFGLPCPIETKIIKAINTNLKWIELCKRDIGWSWTHNSPAHPWPTWSILDTFEEILNCDSLKDVHSSLEEALSPILGKIIESFKKDIAGSYASDWEEKVVNSEPYDVSAALDLSRLMLAISLHGNVRNVKPLAYKLFAWASASDFGNLDYSYYLQPQSAVITDSSLVPSTLRTLLCMMAVLKSKGKSDLYDHIKQNPEVVLTRVYLHLMRNHINHGKFKDLWGVNSDKGLKYELYYTERTIEALTEFLQIYEPGFTAASPSSPKPTESPEERPAAAQEDHATKKIIPDVSPVSPAYLPILDEIARQKRNDLGAELFKDVLIIYVLHFLKDLIPFTSQFQSLGCDPKDMYFLVKTYAYPEKDKLVKYFHSKGCKVFVPKDSLEKTFNNLTSEILTECMKRSENEGKKILIVEDGGYFAPLIHTENFIKNSDRCCGAVEQTTKGYRRDSKIQDPKIPILSIATSKLKLILEADEVAATLGENIVETLRKYNSHRTLNNHTALILGFGTIGQKLAEALLNKGISITVYDTDPIKRLSAEISKFQVLENLDDLSEFHIIIGISGEASLKNAAAFWGLKHNVVLASGSSERLEFDLEALSSISKEILREEVFTKYILKKDDKIIRVLCDGEPINFALSEGISDSVIDPVYTEMFLAAVKVVNERLRNGLQELPKEVEEEVLSVFKASQK